VAVVTDRRRVRIHVEGVVQGVGFRPFVYRLAREMRLTGSVLNDEHGVIAEVEGDGAAVDRFVLRLASEAPPLAAVESVRTEERPPTGEATFQIAASRRGASADAPVTPDCATCDDCLRELLDPADRRYRYPFINCTNCGPRFTIVLGVPYDRPLTTMAAFEMCEACRDEYEDPADRRFHAQPNACPECGPRLSMPLADAVRILGAGGILAVKGLGGHHLACRADDEGAVAALRARKHREEKPFALMAADLAAAREIVELSPEEEEGLTGRERPIVIGRRLPGARVAAAVAPGRGDLGVMLPYTPLHHLLLRDAGTPLVMTSGNVSDEPIAYEDDDARSRLAGIADAFLLHDRPIGIRTDDSVVRGRLILRRSRGWAPAALPLPVAAGRPVLACGAELKNTFCIAKGRRAWVSHHIGDLENFETLRSFTDGIDHFERLFDVRPEMVAHDLHQGYLSTQYAQDLEGVELIGVQHHHAHLAACLAEHSVSGRAVGAIYDGTGDGGDGTVWGGEILAGDLRGFSRAGALWPVRLPGGAQAIRQPWRMACAWLSEIGVTDRPQWLRESVREADWDAVRRLVESGVQAPVTTSMGRLFDAVAALCGLRARVTYEGQAAADLEAVCDPGERRAYPFPVTTDGPIGLDARPTVEAVMRDIAAGVAAGIVAARFHGAVARATAEALTIVAARSGVEVAVLSGGVFQNRVLLESTIEALRPTGLRVLVPRRLPPNDGGISYGQAAVAAALSGGG
jgi:hydrogenase maturation protein HypF